jgi:hypothetical protein
VYYVGMDVHKATIRDCVLDVSGKVVSQSIIETSTQSVSDYFKSLRGALKRTARKAMIAESRRWPFAE